ncbi:MAG: histidinol-phosphate transaminase [Candidatus Omnitrophica bacterium]|nr:histidinol-phosphate transaminase [Candidatus Omnitrophota bacterium]
MENLARKSVFNIAPYVAGKPIEETKRQLGLRDVIKLASNENPLGSSPYAIRAIKKALPEINRYPDSSGFYLKKKIAKTLNLSPANIVLGNGSDELIDIIIKTFVEDDEHIITSDTAFLEYGIISQANAKKIVKVPLKYFKFDLNAIRNKIDKNTKLVFIANPNNPTGTYVNKTELDDFLAGLPKNVIVVLDEAYDVFIDADDFVSGLKYFNKNNVIVLKTFSKAYGLAGLRIGYSIAQSDLCSYMERVRQPFNVNILAQAAAAAALDDKQFIRKTKEINKEGKRFIYDNLSMLGLAYVPTAANFILFDAGRDGLGVFKEMLKFGVIVRDMKQYGLNNFIRVSIGTKKENERFIKVLKKVL